MVESTPYVITLGRMLGCGGAMIGQKLAKELSIKYMDKEILTEAAKEYYLSEDYLEKHDERTTSLWESLLQSPKSDTPYTSAPVNAYFPTQRLLFEMQAKIILRKAAECSAVFIGRAGSYILREHPRHISVFLHSDIEFRKIRVKEVYNLSDKEAKKRITDSDIRREKYLQAFAGNDWTDARQYMICLNTGKIGIEESAEIILSLTKNIFGL